MFFKSGGFFSYLCKTVKGKLKRNCFLNLKVLGFFDCKIQKNPTQMA